MNHPRPLTRRRFLKGALAAPLIVPPTALGLNGTVAPSDRITLGAIGVGSRNRTNLGEFLAQKDAQVLAVCDCFADRRKLAKEMVDKHYGNNDCASYRFHEQVLERNDVDAVLVGTGDRWHAVLSVLAARAGKDVYTEKPFSLTIGEGRGLVKTTERYGTIWQCGTQRKSNPGYKFVVDIVRSGKIGKLHTITTSFGPDPWWVDAFPLPEREPDPAVFDYDRWLGQSPWVPYSAERVKLWRVNWDTSAGAIADMGAHFFEFAQWAHGDEFTAPVEFEGEGVFLDKSGINNTPYFFHVRARYADGVRLLMDTGTKAVHFSGDQGWVRISDEGVITAMPQSVLAGQDVPNGHWGILAPHVRNFLDSVKTRRLTASHPEIAQRAHTIAHCANICLRLGRKLQWDPKRERFTGDDDANRMLSRTMRAPWRI